MPKEKLNIIVFVSQDYLPQLEPLIENRPTALFQVAGKKIIEWFYDIGKQFDVKEIILLANKDIRQLLYKQLGDYQEVSAPPDEIGPFIIKIYDEKKGISKELAKELIAHHIIEESIWIDGNCVFSKSFFENFVAKGKAAGKLTLVSENNHEESLGIGYFKAQFLETVLEGSKSVNDLYTKVRKNTASAFNTLEYKKNEMEFWRIDYLWNLLDANQILINDIPDEKKGTIEEGVTIIGKVAIGYGARIRAGSYLEGPLAIGEKCDIGPNCYLRKGVALAKEVRIGNACELKNTIIYEGSHVAHLSYVGDSIIGAHCNFGAGTITGNLRLDDSNIKVQTTDEVISSERRKLGVIMGDNVKTAINTYFMPGVVVGNNSAIGTGVIVSRNVPSEKFVYIEQDVKTRDWKIKPKKK
ncbi:MAG: hypothetical protein FK734_13025 [Asgard group archaeon]|nr:hypothetical protein [Asgard group archaeon]